MRDEGWGVKKDGMKLIRHPSCFVPRPYSNEEGWMDFKIDEGLKALLESGKDKGYLTYSQVNDYLPDDAVNPEKLDQLLLILEEHGIELIDESEAEEREGAPGAPILDDEVRAELEIGFFDEGDSRRIDDPVRMYLTQMGSIPLLRREE